ncbi:MAG: AmmeMemoRadiSam system radical SAM enzyme [Bacteroidota bacterium]|nr:AmmeMemoRadiSam system radical SAM enzyme [Bacteroidota bacterium]
MSGHLPAMNKREFLRFCAAGVGYAFLRDMTKASPFPVNAGSREEFDWKWKKEALFYRKSARGVKCLKCPNFCDLADGETGKCRNRENHGGTLYSIAYGNPCAVHVDPIEKKPLFHFLPATRAFSIAAAGCNLRCLNCQNWQISQFSPRETRNEELFPDDVVREARQEKCASIAYTYSEPTSFYEYTLDTAVAARRKGIRNILKSNGTINEEPLRRLASVLDAANIDLKTFDAAVYKKLSEGFLSTVLRTLEVLKSVGVWLEITYLVIPTWTDDFEKIRSMCSWLVAKGLADCPLHFTRFMPLYKLNRLPPTPVGSLERARKIAFEAGVRYVYVGNVPGHEAENTYCHACGKKIVERRGFTIVSMRIEKGKCAFCSAPIPGVWS